MGIFVDYNVQGARGSQGLQGATGPNGTVEETYSLIKATAEQALTLFETSERLIAAGL